MATFTYIARDKRGKRVQGKINADSVSSLVQQLKQQGLTPTSVSTDGSVGGGEVRRADASGWLSRLTRLLSASGPAEPRNRRVKASELVVFTRQLATTINAGLPLMQGLDIMGEQTEDRNFKLLPTKIAEDVESGESFSDALKKHPKIFSNLYVAMIRAGEASGNLDGILNQLASYLEATEALKHRIKSAMTYPTVAFFLVLTIAIGLLVYVVPKFEDIFASFDAELPGPTLMLMHISRLCRDNFMYVAGGMVALLVFAKLYTKTETGRYQFDLLKLNLPVFGQLFRKVAISRFTRTFSTLTRSGVPILQALEIVENTAGNTVFARAINSSQDNVRAGQSLSEPLAQSGMFPPMVTRMISVGEKTGALEQLLLKISQFYDQEVEATVAQLTSLIEPLLIVMLGIMVGGIVIALFLPIFQLPSLIR